jgi:HK97 family phage major capsid protein
MSNLEEVKRDLKLDLTRTLEIKDLEVGEIRSEGDFNYVDISFSSEYPYERPGEGLEILSHAPGAMDMTYAKDGMPFLVDHIHDDATKLIGIVENIRIENKKGRGSVRFSNANPLSAIVFSDMKANIRKSISVGYQVLARTALRPDGSYLVTEWMPFEASSVTVPADPTVGVNKRNADLEENSTETKANDIETDEVKPLPENEKRDLTVWITDCDSSVVIPKMEDAQEELEQNPDINNVEENNCNNQEETRAITKDKSKVWIEEIRYFASKHDLNMKAIDLLLSNENNTEAQIRKEIMSELENKTTTYQEAVEQVRAEKKVFSLGRALAAQMNGSWEKAGFEREVSNFISQYRQSANPAAIYLERSLMRGSNTVALNNTGNGVDFNYVEYAGWLPALKEYTAVLKAGAQVVPCSTGTYQYTKQAGPRPSAQWSSENGSATTASAFPTTVLNCTPDTLSDSIELSRLALSNSPENMSGIAEEELNTRFGIAIDRAAIVGAGTGNSPLGILKYTTGAVGSGKVVTIDSDTGAGGSANGLTVSGGTFTKMLANVDSNFALTDNASFILSPAMKWKLANIAKNGSNLTTAIVDNGKIFGYNAYTSASIPTNGTQGTHTGTDLHSIAFGDFKNLVIVEFGPMEILINPYSQSRNQIVQYDANMLVNMLVQYPQAFSICSTAILPA